MAKIIESEKSSTASSWVVQPMTTKTQKIVLNVTLAQRLAPNM